MPVPATSKITQPTVGDKFYRIYAQSYSTIVDAEREVFGVSPLYLEESIYEVVKLTPKGVWLNFGEWRLPKNIFVLNGSRKKFAYPTREEALEGFIQKKKRHVSILAAQHDDAKAALDLALDVQSGRPTWHRNRTKIGVR